MQKVGELYNNPVVILKSIPPMIKVMVDLKRKYWFKNIEMLKSGTDLRYIQELLLGHSGSKTNEI
jgi:hypothetical protein